MRLAVLPALLLSTVAHAQQPIPRGEPPTAGVAVPSGALAGDPEATAVQLNPANLAFLSSWNVFYLHTELDAGGTIGGRGDGLYLASPVPFLDQLAVGAAVESVRPPSSFPFRNEGKLSLALAWRPLRFLSFGATYAHVFTGDTPGTSGIDTLDLAGNARLGRYVAAALVVHDVPSPFFQGLGLQRVYEPELTFRPLGDDRLELALAARVGERRRDFDPRFRIQVIPTPGLTLRAALELKRDIDGDGKFENDLRATAGVVLDIDRFGLGGYARFGSSSGAGHFHGWSVTARLSGDRYPSLYAPRRLERIDLGPMSERQRTALLAHLRSLERRPRTDGVVMVLGDVSGSWGTLEELRAAFLRLRAAGLHVYAFGTEIGTKGYYVGSAAEKLWIDPAGGLRLIGISATSTYFKGTFDLLGVRADFVKIAEYKSAPEQYTRSAPSDEARAVRKELLDDIYGRMVQSLAESRHVDAARMRHLIDVGPYTASEAARDGLVDGVKGGEEVEDAIGELLHHPVEAVPPETRPRRPKSFAPRSIAVIYIDGDIVEGKSQNIPIIDIKLCGQQTILQAIVDARSDSRVEAIVVRIDSPGGSALASDLIGRELERTRRVKPVLCSLGDTAASGGYYIAAACDAIYASPSTVTGSIGIFTGKFDVSGLAEKLGVSWTTARRGEHADIESYWRSYTDEERRILLEKLRYYYDRFVAAVARGRSLPPADVETVARGHVWTGAQAAKHKLVDHLGGFLDAVVDAKRRAGLEEWDPIELVPFPAEEPSLLGELAELLGIRLRAGETNATTLLTGPLLRAAAALPASLWVAPSTPQARMDFALDAP